MQENRIRKTGEGIALRKPSKKQLTAAQFKWAQDSRERRIDAVEKLEAELKQAQMALGKIERMTRTAGSDYEAIHHAAVRGLEVE